MELTPTLILNLALLIVPPVVLVLVFRQWLARHIRWTVALTALCDVLLFWDELFYYESFGLFAVLILVQLAATGAAAFRIYNKQKKGLNFMSILQTIDLKKYYGTEPNITRALDGVNFSVEDGEFVAVVGTSGSGKSTLLHMMGGLDTPTSGNVIVRDKELSKMNDEQLTIFRRRNIGFIFQNYNLVPILNVYENIVLPVELDGDTVDQKFLDEIVHLLGLEDKLKNMPNNLSGGQQQRVAIARALITKPAIVLADEPTGNLDSKTSAEVLGLIKRTSAEFRQTVVMITHNNDIARLADRIVRIEDGKIVE